MNRIVSLFLAGARRRTVLPCVCLLTVLAVVGCRSLQDAVTGANNNAALPGATDAYRVRADTTSFFLISPLQASGPDEQLKKDTELMMVSRTRSYSRVKTPKGELGYVATEDIGPLTDQEVATANASNIQAQLEAQRQVAARTMGGSGYTIPPEAGNQEKLPEPDLPRSGGPKVNTRPESVPTPNPIFRQ